MHPESEDILVVEDDEGRRDLIGSILADEGFRVIAVADALSAMRVVSQGPVSLIIAAVDLPGTLDGVTLVHQARLRRPSTNALLVGDQPSRPRSANPDRDEFIAAPFHRRDLLGCVFELLQRRVIPGAGDLARRCRAEAYAS